MRGKHEKRIASRRQAVLPALESFFAFVLEHWAGGEGDVYGSLGAGEPLCDILPA